MHGVTFDNKHSFRTWGLFLKVRPEISPPKPQTKLIHVPGTNKIIDLTESLTGDVRYEPRRIKCIFCVVGGRPNWSAVYSAVLNDVHGKRMKIVMDDDPNYYYIGRVEVNQWESEEAIATIVIEADVEPFKYARHGGGRRL